MILHLEDDITNETMSLQYWERVQGDPVGGDSLVQIKVNLTVADLHKNTKAFLVSYANETKVRCCTDGVGCVVGESIVTDGTFLMKQIFELVPSKSFTFEWHREVTDTSTYTFEMLSCDLVSVEVSADITWKSSHGYLPPEDFPLIVIYEGFAVVLALVFLTFFASLLSYRVYLFKIHYGILLVLFLFLLKEVGWTLYYRSLNLNGEADPQYLGFVVFLQLTARIVNMVLLLVLSIGIGTNIGITPVAKEDVINIGGLASDEDESENEDPFVPPPLTTPPSLLRRICVCLPSTQTKSEPPSCDKPLMIKIVIFSVLTFVFQYIFEMQDLVIPTVCFFLLLYISFFYIFFTLSFFFPFSPHPIFPSFSLPNFFLGSFATICD
eukprot:TRINITY_DN1018_c0_g1_i7.p1 TRINITY_DN1018_c0_g1~~TRINITY_DN1018_c0_g1_i7.p1  ORF type:complete len:423 (-),score=77.12 TRINITY_DN1018_c0_g1_i7:766-1908(-)